MIDSHCHINDQLYLNEADNYVKEAISCGVNAMLVVGYDLKSSISACEIASKFNCVYAAVGIHPSEIKNMNESDLEKIEHLLTNKKVIAIGEIGLDFYWDKDEEIKTKQKEYFIKQIELANKYHLPISIHSREANEECLKILENHKPSSGGIMHCYSGSIEMAPRFIKFGLLLGIGGTVTFKNAVKIKEVAKNISNSDYVLETDAPYLAPTPYRGKPNHSKYLPLIALEIAKLRGEPIEKIYSDTDYNFKKMFKI